MAGIMGAAVPLMLLLCGGWLCVRLKGFAFLHPLRTLRAAGGSAGSRRALWMALGGTLGVGNIAGVCLSLAVGGAGSLLWMWVCALLSMFIKYAEVTLALGGTRAAHPYAPAPSLSYLFGQNRLSHAGGWLFCLCGLGLTMTLGGMIQSNAVAASFADTFCFQPILTGVLLSALTFAVISGGGKRISSVTLRLIPLAAALYSLLCLWVIVRCRAALPQALGAVFSGAFSPRAVGGGSVGWLVALETGCARGLLSNEAGCGTAPMAHATADGADPARQGVMGMIEVAVDTLLLCTLTGLAVLTAFPDGIPSVETGLEPVRQAFSLVLGPAASAALTVLVLLFAFGTVICWGYYGEVCARALTGGKTTAMLFYPFLLPAAVLLGAVFVPSFLWSATDLLLGVMVAVNLAAILRCRREILPPF